MGEINLAPASTPESLFCPVHGSAGAWIGLNTGQGYKGKWCLRCFMDMLDKMGVQRVKDGVEGWTGVAHYTGQIV